MTWKIRGNFLKIHMKLSIFLEEISDHNGYSSMFLPQLTVLENLNFDLEKSWKNAYGKV